MIHVCANSLDGGAEMNISGGLVEIAALTAVIGGSTAELIALGNRGACIVCTDIVQYGSESGRRVHGHGTLLSCTPIFSTGL